MDVTTTLGKKKMGVHGAVLSLSSARNQYLTCICSRSISCEHHRSCTLCASEHLSGVLLWVCQPFPSCFCLTVSDFLVVADLFPFALSIICLTVLTIMQVYFFCLSCFRLRFIVALTTTISLSRALISALLARYTISCGFVPLYS